MRTSRALRDTWWIKQLEVPEPDVTALSNEVSGAHPVGQGWLVATMPAQVHDVLLAHGRIPDPRWGKNAAESAWVGEKDWVYGHVFPTPESSDGLGRTGPVFLRFKGLDTLATVYLNGEEVGHFENMHHAHTVEVREQLRSPGEDNVLILVFASPLRFVAQTEPAEGIPAYHYIRKCRSDFTSYLGARPHAVKVGVFDDVVLDVPDRAWVEDVTVRSELAEDYSSAQVKVRAALRSAMRGAVGGGTSEADAALELALTLTDPKGNLVLTSVVSLDEAVFEKSAVLNVEDPLLWWPRTHGAPNLYRLTVDLQSGGERLDRHLVEFGIRQVAPVLIDPATGEDRFAFEVNGQRIFLRGACWAPLQGMTHRWDDERADQLLDLVEQGQMNVLRVWGGGAMPPDAFYQACDRRGILIWQDFMFGYGMYPDDDPDFVANCRTEIASVVRRLRNHPSLLLWCGGNENHMGWDFAFGEEPTTGRALFEEVMPEICSQLDTDRLFHPSSPYGGPVPNWPLKGDWHDYTTLTFSP
ncbi:MAG: glycoside hydrolase family 2 protein, partial [Anaerolineae bacterium]